MTDGQQNVSPREALDGEFAYVFDIRMHASTVPRIEGAVPVPADDLASSPANHIADPDASILVVCDIGIRSSVITDLLRANGYSNARSLDGGMEAWFQADQPLTVPRDLTPAEFRRYDRQIKLPEFGVPGQTALLGAHVAVVGAGGLGVPALMYLVGAGVGTVTIIDSDVIEASNLHRQPIYSSHHVGQPKSGIAAAAARELNPGITVRSRHVRLDEDNARELLDGHDAVAVCTDSFETAHTINRTAHELGIPIVFASVYRTEGQLAVFSPPRGPCYACVFPLDSGSSGLDCSIVGVLGTVTGVLGSMQATEVVKLLTGLGDENPPELVLYDGLKQTMEAVTIRKRPDCGVCGTGS